MQRPKLVSGVFLSLILLPSALARGTAIPGLDQGIELISSFFYPSVLMRSPAVQVGFYKFLYFIIIFSAVNYVMRKFIFKDSSGHTASLAHKSSGVISFSFAAISAFFMPVSVAQASGGYITAIFNALIPIGITIGAIFVAFKKLKGEWWQHLLGMLLLLFALVSLSWVLNIVG